MCFGSKDQSNAPAPRQAPLPRPQPSNSALPSKAQDTSSYSAPPGPPPSKQDGPSNDYFAPPSGPPPSSSRQAHDDGFAPPPGPPPSQDYAPPSGPPPSQGENKKHAWEEAVPDTSLLPPPPNYFGSYDRSPTNNATEQEAEEGEAWCRRFPLYNPLQLDAPALNALQVGNINLFAPPSFKGAIAQTGTGVWKGYTAGASDTCIASYPPLYSVSTHSPLATGRKRTIYYEVNILKDSPKEVSLALGFVAPPYPSFRLPGWHRGSVGVHGDDGHRYINDRWGGKDFTTPFKRGETVGIGMNMSPGQGGGITTEIFHTKEGREVGRWDLHEEIDTKRDLPVTGLEGFHDLCAAIGVYDKVNFEIVFAPGQWKWKGYEG
ncbi:SPRY domain-containing protein [Seiridium cupressi]